MDDIQLFAWVSVSETWWGIGIGGAAVGVIGALICRWKRAPVKIINYIDTKSEPPDTDRQLREAIKSETARGLQETIRSLPQNPLGAGHTYARLPDGTNIVSMADGTYRLALPVRIAGKGSAHFPDGSAKMTARKSDPEE